MYGTTRRADQERMLMVCCSSQPQEKDWQAVADVITAYSSSVLLLGMVCAGSIGERTEVVHVRTPAIATKAVENWPLLASRTVLESNRV